MEILELIDKLEGLAAHAKKVPLSGRSVIDAERLLALVDQMRLAVPRNVTEAQEVLERREQILSQTVLDAKRMKSVAENEAGKRVEDSELVKGAKKRGDDMVHDAEIKAERLLHAAENDARSRRAQADQYAQETLAKLEEEVSTILGTVRSGIRVLSASMDTSDRFARAN